jgi:hypothetical protein
MLRFAIHLWLVSTMKLVSIGVQLIIKARQ